MMIACGGETQPAAAPQGPLVVPDIAALLERSAPAPVPVDALDAAEQTLWSAHRAAHSAPLDGEVALAGHTLPFTTHGVRPASGFPLYIVLDDRAPSPYLPSIKTGISVSLSDLSTPASAIEELIEAMLLQDVDSDRVYMLGHGEGAAAAARIAPAIADRLAAVSCAAGDVSGLSPDNLYRLPTLVQVGQSSPSDAAARALDATLDALHAASPEGYIHDLLVHTEADWSDHAAADVPQPVLADLHSDAGIGKRDTNAVRWVRRYIRSPWPDRIVWDRTTAAEGRAGERGALHYWVQASDGDRIEVAIDRGSNTVTVAEAGQRLRLLLNHRMLDLRRPITISAGEQRLSVTPAPDLRTMARTLTERGDQALMFSVSIDLEQVGGVWQLASSAP